MDKVRSRDDLGNYAAITNREQLAPQVSNVRSLQT